MIVDATGGRIAVSITTNVFHQLCASHDAIGILNEKLQSLVSTLLKSTTMSSKTTRLALAGGLV